MTAAVGQGVEITLTGIQQNGMSPYAMRCYTCGEEWEPRPNKAGEITDHMLDASAKKHWRECPKG